RAVSMAAGCGVGLLATVHASGPEELSEKPLYRDLLERRVFRQAVRIIRDADGRRYEAEEL
ncbi:MAG: stage III sporulation protein AA, partial [Oscillospiraceae bacterium]|nr:stage III sporulation protein AA [Oscillospiraceae bacterium]